MNNLDCCAYETNQRLHRVHLALIVTSALLIAVTLLCAIRYYCLKIGKPQRSYQLSQPSTL